MQFSNVIKSCLKGNVYKDWLYSFLNIYSNILEEKVNSNFLHYVHNYVQVSGEKWLEVHRNTNCDYLDM